MYIQDIAVSMFQLDVVLLKAMAFNRGTCQKILDEQQMG